MNRFRRLPLVLLACLAAVGMVVPLNAVIGQRAVQIAEEERTERTDTGAAVPFASSDRSRSGPRARVLPPLPVAPTPGLGISSTSRPLSTTPRTESGHTLRNGLGTFYRC